MNYQKLFFVVLIVGNFCACAMTGKMHEMYYREAVDGCYQDLGAEAYEKLGMPVERRAPIMVACDPVGKSVCLATVIGHALNAGERVAACAVPDDFVCIDQAYMDTLPYGVKRFTIFHEVAHCFLGDHVRMATLDACAMHKAERAADRLAVKACCCQDCLIEQSTHAMSIQREILDLLHAVDGTRLFGCDASGNLSQLSLFAVLTKKYSGKFCAEHSRLRNACGKRSVMLDQALYDRLRGFVVPAAINMLARNVAQFKRTYKRLWQLYRFLTPALDDSQRNELIRKVAGQ